MIFDLETNHRQLDRISVIWCICAMDPDSGERFEFEFRYETASFQPGCALSFFMVDENNSESLLKSSLVKRKRSFKPMATIISSTASIFIPVRIFSFGSLKSRHCSSFSSS